MPTQDAPTSPHDDLAPMEVTDEGYGTVDTDYIADITAAQGTWDPWPTTAQDTPMPTQDAPTSPHDDLAPAQDD